MGKSYKKQPYCQRNDKFMKKKANHTIRKIDDIPNGSAYKKFFCSWKISDYGWYCSYKQYLIDRTNWRTFSYHADEEEILHDWFKFYKAK